MFFTADQLLSSLDDTISSRPIVYIKQITDAVKQIFTDLSASTVDDLKCRACKIWNSSIRKDMDNREEDADLSAELKRLTITIFQMCSRTLDDTINLLQLTAKTASCFSF